MVAAGAFVAQDVAAVGAAATREGVVDVGVGEVLVLVLDGGGLVGDVVEDAACFGKCALCVGQGRLFHASVALDYLLRRVGVELLGILEILLRAELLVELGGNECGGSLRAGIGSAAGIGVPWEPESARLSILVGALYDVVVEHLTRHRVVGTRACCLGDVHEGEHNPTHVVGVRVLEHLVVRACADGRGGLGGCSCVVVGLVLVPELDVVEVFVGKGCIDAFVPLVVVDDHVDGVRLRPVGVEGVLLVADVEVALVLYHE